MDRRRQLRIAAPIAWVAATVVLVVLQGVPTKHDVIFLWLGLGMAAFSLEVSRVVRDWLPLVGVIFVYDLLRGAADGLLFQVHESPQIPNYGRQGTRDKIRAGYCFAIEPMLNIGTRETQTLSDGWTVVTLDGKPSAHAEHSVAITAEGPEILTLTREQKAERTADRANAVP